MPQPRFNARLASMAAPALLMLSGATLAADAAPAAPTAAPAAAAAPATPAEVGYSIGVSFGAQLHAAGLDHVDTDGLLQGLKAGLGGAMPGNTDQQRVMTAVREAQAALSAKNNAEASEFLAKNGKEPGVVTTASGLQYRVINAGDTKAASPKVGDQVTVNYSGQLLDGTEFDSSYKRGQPATFGVGQVIKGWTEALQLMHPGAKYQLFIPPQLAYGDSPRQGGPIKPGSLLKFDVELLKVAPPPAAPAASKPKPGAAGAKKPAAANGATGAKKSPSTTTAKPANQGKAASPQ